MKKLFFAFLVLVLGWDVIWSLLGVKPLFPWQLQQKMARHPSDLVLLAVRTPLGISLVSPPWRPKCAF